MSTKVRSPHAILDSGLKTPDDIAIIGCGNVRYSDSLRVPLTTIDQDCEGLGTHAARLALRLLESKTPPEPQTIFAEPRSIVRDFTGR